MRRASDGKGETTVQDVSVSGRKAGQGKGRLCTSDNGGNAWAIPDFKKRQLHTVGEETEGGEVMEKQTVINILSESISNPFAKAINIIKLLGMSKEEALEMTRTMVELAYASPDVREQMLAEFEEKINV